MRLLHFNIKREEDGDYQAICYEIRDILVTAPTLDELMVAVSAELDVKHNDLIDVQLF